MVLEGDLTLGGEHTTQDDEHTIQMMSYRIAH